MAPHDDEIIRCTVYIILMYHVRVTKMGLHLRDTDRPISVLPVVSATQLASIKISEKRPDLQVEAPARVRSPLRAM